MCIDNSETVDVRRQSATEDFTFGGGMVTLRQPTAIAYFLGSEGSEWVVVDGGMSPMTMAGGTEPIVIGASEAACSIGTANSVYGFLTAKTRVRRSMIEPFTTARCRPVLSRARGSARSAERFQ